MIYRHLFFGRHLSRAQFLQFLKFYNYNMENEDDIFTDDIFETLSTLKSQCEEIKALKEGRACPWYREKPKPNFKNFERISAVLRNKIRLKPSIIGFSEHFWAFLGEDGRKLFEKNGQAAYLRTARGYYNKINTN
jgi:hypothetical protein